MNFRRWVQIFSLVCFWGLLIAVLNGFTSAFQVDLFLKFDPSAVAVSALAGRTLAFGVVPAIIVLLLGLLLGRFFCGYVCPMGTTLDAADKLFGVPPIKRKNTTFLRPLKYLVLTFMMVAALFGVSFVF